MNYKIIIKLFGKRARLEDIEFLPKIKEDVFFKLQDFDPFKNEMQNKKTKKRK